MRLCTTFYIKSANSIEISCQRYSHIECRYSCLYYVIVNIIIIVKATSRSIKPRDAEKLKMKYGLANYFNSYVNLPAAI